MMPDLFQLPRQPRKDEAHDASPRSLPLDKVREREESAEEATRRAGPSTRPGPAEPQPELVGTRRGDEAAT